MQGCFVQGKFSIETDFLTLTTTVISRRGVRGYQYGRGLFLCLTERLTLVGGIFSLLSVGVTKSWRWLTLDLLKPVG